MADTGNEQRPGPDDRRADPADTAGEHALPSQDDAPPPSSGRSPRHALPDDMQPDYVKEPSREAESPQSPAPASPAPASSATQRPAEASETVAGTDSDHAHPHPAYEDYEPPTSAGVEPAVLLSALLAGLVAAWLILRGRSSEDES